MLYLRYVLHVLKDPRKVKTICENYFEQTEEGRIGCTFGLRPLLAFGYPDYKDNPDSLD